MSTVTIRDAHVADAAALAQIYASAEGAIGSQLGASIEPIERLES